MSLFDKHHSGSAKPKPTMCNFLTVITLGEEHECPKHPVYPHPNDKSHSLKMKTIHPDQFMIRAPKDQMSRVS